MCKEFGKMVGNRKVCIVLILFVLKDFMWKHENAYRLDMRLLLTGNWCNRSEGIHEFRDVLAIHELLAELFINAFLYDTSMITVNASLMGLIWGNLGCLLSYQFSVMHYVY